jgi:hypothetical protein
MQLKRYCDDNQFLIGLRAHAAGRGPHRLARVIAPRQEAGPCLRQRVPLQSSLFALVCDGDLSELIDWHIYFLGAYARAELVFLEWCAKILTMRYGAVNFFDVGANAGQHYSPACAWVELGCHLIDDVQAIGAQIFVASSSLKLQGQSRCVLSIRRPPPGWYAFFA